MMYSHKKMHFIMKGLIVLSIVWAAGACSSLENSDIPVLAAPPAYPGLEWEKVEDPTTFGWSPENLEQARQQAEKINSESVMIVDSGRLIAAWGDISDVYYIASCRKSILSILYGAYVEDSTIRLNSTLEEIGISDNEGLLDAEKQARISHLLTSSSGIFHPAAATNNQNLPPRGSQTPGEQFYYNNWDFNALGTIFNTLTGEDLYEEFDQRIAQPIGMQDFVIKDHGRYDYSSVSEHPAYHFDMSARDMARFGLLCLREGKWKEAQLISSDWLSKSTQPLADAHDFGNSAYGYMWWVVEGDIWGEIGVADGSYSAQGNWAQIILIIPSQDLVIVHRGKGNRGDNIKGDELAQLIEMILASKSS